MKKIVLLCLFLFLPWCAFASETGINSWENILTNVADSLTGPVAYALSIMAIFACGITIAFVDLQGGAKRFVQVACGLSVALFASEILTGFFGFSGAVL